MEAVGLFVLFAAAALFFTGLQLLAAVLVYNLWREPMSDALARLKAAVEALDNVGASVAAAVDKLVEQIREAADNGASEEDLNALADQLEGDKAEITAAILRGTPAEPAPEPAPEPEPEADPGPEADAGPDEDAGPEGDPQ